LVDAGKETTSSGGSTIIVHLLKTLCDDKDGRNIYLVLKIFIFPRYLVQSKKF